MGLDGKVVLVTGSAKGIGKGCARVLGKHGARIAVVDLDPVAGPLTAKEIEAGGGRAVFFQADVSKADDVQKMIARLLEVSDLPVVQKLGQVSRPRNIAEKPRGY